MCSFRGSGAVLLWLSTAVHAQLAEPPQNLEPDSAARVVWHCWYGSEPEHVTCFRPAPVAAGAEPLNPIEAAIQTMANQLLQAGSHVAATRVFRRFPESFSGTTQRIPLHTIPFDLESVARLSHSVMCGRSRIPCAVAFDLRWNTQENAPPINLRRRASSNDY